MPIVFLVGGDGGSRVEETERGWLELMQRGEGWVRSLIVMVSKLSSRLDYMEEKQ